MANTITITVEGEDDFSADIEKGLDRVKGGLDDVAHEAAASGDKMKRDFDGAFDKLGEGAGGAEQKFIGLKDSITGTQDVMAGLKNGDVVTLATGLADLAGAAEALWASVGKVITKLWAKVTAMAADSAATISNTAATVAHTVATWAAEAASKAWAAAQWLLNAALNANPIALVVIAIAALVAAIVLAYQHSETFRDIVDSIGRFLRDKLLPAIVDVASWIGDKLVPVFQAIWDIISNYVIPAFAAYYGFIFTKVIPAIADIVSWVIDKLVPAFSAMWSFVQDHVIPGFQDLWNIITDKVIPKIADLVGKVREFAEDAKEKFDDFKTGVTVVFDAVVDKVNDVKDTFNRLIDFIKELPGRVTDAAKGMFDGIPGAGSITSIVGKIPGFAKGGIVTKPTLAVIGEDGPEAVVPLSGTRSGRALAPMLAGGGGGGGQVIVNVNTLSAATGAEAVARGIATAEHRGAYVRADQRVSWGVI